ncbi:MAG: transglutaminase-like domain-containing protein [Bacteroidales bacterium]|nr:transglutaminase-like domain-containing protein [Bacteroidales bacterium]
MKNLFSFLFICLSVLTSCSNNKKSCEKYQALIDSALVKAGENNSEILTALNNVDDEKKEGMAFLISYMPEWDLKRLNSDFILNNVNFAYKVKNQYPWCSSLPDSVFFNEVLPYYNVTENRDDWRENFYNRFSPYVKDCSDIRDAIDSINKNIRNELLVDYNTKRRASDQGPFESIESSMASCTGLSILLTDAFRSVGIPSRFAGTNNWFDNRGNHSWVEVYIDGQWYFTEYYPQELNKSWFAADAAKATIGDKNHGIFAVSYKPAECYFPVVWDENKNINAVEVTQRYIDVCSYAINKSAGDSRVKLEIEVYNENGIDKNHNNRVAADLTLFCDGNQVGGGTSCSNKDDLNNVFYLLVDPNKKYEIVVVYQGKEKRVFSEVLEADKIERIVL